MAVLGLLEHPNAAAVQLYLLLINYSVQLSYKQASCPPIKSRKTAAFQDGV